METVDSNINVFFQKASYICHSLFLTGLVQPFGWLCNLQRKAHFFSQAIIHSMFNSVQSYSWNYKKITLEWFMPSRAPYHSRSHQLEHKEHKCLARYFLLSKIGFQFWRKTSRDLAVLWTNHLMQNSCFAIIWQIISSYLWFNLCNYIYC